VAKALRGLRLADDLVKLPTRGDKIFQGEKEMGYITSALASPRSKQTSRSAMSRREGNEIGTELKLRSSAGEDAVRIVALPFS